MNNEITAEEVAQQFVKSIQLLVAWVEKRDNAKIQRKIKPNKDDYGKHELLKAADAVKILKISKSMMFA